MDLLELLPEIILYGFGAAVAGIVLVVVWIVWGSYLSVPAPGQIVGYYRIFGRFGKLHDEFRGRLVDATSFFLHPSMLGKFKGYTIKDLEELLERTSDAEAKETLETALEKLENCPAQELSNLCRVIVTRERFTKHAFIQIGNPLKPITEYATARKEHRFSFGFGPESEGVISGDLYTLPIPWEKIPEVGKCQVHIFYPQEREPSGQHSPEQYDWLANVLKIPLSVQSKERVESLENEVAQQERARMELERDLDAARSELSVMRRMLRSQGVEPRTLESLMPRQLDVIDFLLIAVPAFLGNHLTQYVADMDPYVGLFIGLVAGFFLVYRRLRR